jgi:hypothetical protein
MNSRIIGRIVFNEECLQEDIRKILRFNFNQTYAEYSIGEWKNCVLWNGSGAQLDANFRGYEGAIQKTELGSQLD